LVPVPEETKSIINDEVSSFFLKDLDQNLKHNTELAKSDFTINCKFVDQKIYLPPMLPIDFG